VDLPTPPLWFVSTMERVMLDISSAYSCDLNETACETNELPTRAMLGKGVLLASATVLQGGLGGCMSLLSSPQKPNRLISGHQRGKFRALGERDTLEEFNYAGIL